MPGSIVDDLGHYTSLHFAHGKLPVPIRAFKNYSITGTCHAKGEKNI
jgi:hypothetical protein